MKNRMSARRKVAQNSTFAPLKSALISSDFNIQPQAEKISLQDLETTSQLGHNLNNISVFATSTQSSALPIQPKLTIGQPGDKYEQEADRVAAEVVSKINSPATSPVQRQQMTEEDETLQMKPMLQRLSTGETMAATPDLENTIQSSRGSGQPLADSIRQPMEQAFGANFEGVRVHTGTQSDELNQSIQAKAFTTGQDIFFRQGEYNPGNQGGQELLAHELTHVVQQSGDKVQRRTAQIQEKSVTNPTTIQRKIAFTGYEAKRLQHKEVVGAIIKHEDFLKKVCPKNFEGIKKELSEELRFAYVIKRLVESPVDYGEINLNNPQHFAQFFNDAGKFLNSNYEKQIEKEQPEKKLLEEDKKLWEEQKQTSPDSKKSYKTALLGTGASIANYLNVNGRSLDPSQTVIIGKIQPWDPSKTNPESRGIDFINHPMHMTSPVRHQTQLPKNEDGSDEVFKGNAQKLTNDIEQVMARFKPLVDATILKVERQEDKWYKIETDKDVFYALKVISGLGIGPHKFDGMNKLSKEITKEEHKKIEENRVMDIDAFQRQLKDDNSDIMKTFKKDENNFSVGVAGPNAGVDAVHTATEKGMIVKWVVTGGPAIAEGMGNKISRKKLVDLFFDYLNGWTISAAGFVKMDISGKWRGNNPQEQRKQAGEKFVQQNPDWDVLENQEALVDYLVIAQGPDVEKVWNIFDPSATKDLTLKSDKQGRFGANESEDIWQGSVQTSLRSSTYNIYWEGIYELVKSVLGEENVLAWKKTMDNLLQQAKDILDVKGEFENITLQENVAIGLGSEDDSLEIIGGSAIRILNYLDGQSKAKNSKVQVPEKLKGGNMEEKMKKVTETLSSPTILNNDQLTPIRSQVEALGDYMPGYIGTEESNFVTDDQSMIAAQIASYYGNIPAALANWVTQKIIQERHEEGVKPGTEKGSRAFVKRWKDKLELLHNLFSRESIQNISKS